MGEPQLDLTSRELSLDSRDHREPRTLPRPLSKFRVFHSALILLGTMASVSRTSTSAGTRRPESTTNASGARSDPATETTVSSGPPSERTCHQEPWVPPLESCSTLTSKSENLFEKQGS